MGSCRCRVSIVNDSLKFPYHFLYFLPKIMHANFVQDVYCLFFPWTFRGVHTIPDFLGYYYDHFLSGDHFLSNLGIISGPGDISRPVSSASLFNSYV